MYFKRISLIASYFDMQLFRVHSQVSSTRRIGDFFLLAIACASAVSMLNGAEVARPNIVFILSDDHAWQSISAYGDSRHLIQTPNIDRIAREGMRFDRCLVTNSICGPSRATILTGKYSHLNGFYNNSNCSFDGSQTTFPKLLHKAGYQTYLVGKWHLVSNPTGFDEWDILQGQGTYYNPIMIRNGDVTHQKGYTTDLITDHAIDLLEHRDTNKPFLLMCQHKATHRAWEPALRDLGFDKNRQYAEPDTLFDDYANRGAAEHEQQMSIAKDLKGFDLKTTPPNSFDAIQRKTWDEYFAPMIQQHRAAKLNGDALVRWKYQRYLEDYLACVKGLDDNIGRLLQYLDDKGLAKNTIVVYSSDQGFFLGEHGWFDKRWIFEESLRTPLVVRWPEHTAVGKVNSDIVSNLDFAETFLDAAQVSIPVEMQGRSLLPLLAGKIVPEWRKHFYYHYYEYPQPHHVRPHYGIVTDRYKLVHFYHGDSPGYWELFDRQTDPQEMQNVWGRPDYQEAQQKLSQELAILRRDLKVPDIEPASVFGK